LTYPFFFSHSQFSIYARVYTSFELLLHACWFNSQSSFHFFLVLTREVLVAKRVNAFQASIWKVIRPYRRMDGDLGSARSLLVWYYVRYVEELSKRESQKKRKEIHILWSLRIYIGLIGNMHLIRRQILILIISI
jgi:hypothetical protein